MSYSIAALQQHFSPVSVRKQTPLPFNPLDEHVLCVGRRNRVGPTVVVCSFGGNEVSKFVYTFWELTGGGPHDKPHHFPINTKVVQSSFDGAFGTYRGAFGLVKLLCVLDLLFMHLLLPCGCYRYKGL